MHYKCIYYLQIQFYYLVVIGVVVIGVVGFGLGVPNCNKTLGSLIERCKSELKIKYPK